MIGLRDITQSDSGRFDPNGVVAHMQRGVAAPRLNEVETLAGKTAKLDKLTDFWHRRLPKGGRVDRILSNCITFRDKAPPAPLKMRRRVNRGPAIRALLDFPGARS